MEENRKLANKKTWKKERQQAEIYKKQVSVKAVRMIAAVVLNEWVWINQSVIQSVNDWINEWI